MPKNNSKRNNVTKLHYLPKMNIGMFFLAVIFVYMIFSIILYTTKEQVLIYEVTAGELVSDNTFSGVLIFDESAVNSPYAGYINYFLADNERAGTKTIICTVDETGTVSSKLAQESDSNVLNSSTLQHIRKSLTDYSSAQNELSFYQSYNLLNNINSIITEYNASYMIDSLHTLLETEGNFVSVIQPDHSTFVSFTTDSMFGLTASQVTADSFNMENYSTNNLKNRSLIGVNDILYRSINSETWNVVFKLTDNQRSTYANVSNVTVRFLSNDLTTNASFSIIQNSDGSYGMLTLNKYLVNFAGSRYVDFELTESSPSGLKIPASAVCEKEFFTIPAAYGHISDDESHDTGFLLLTYDSQGNQIRKFVAATYYGNDNGYYYVNKDLFQVGDCIVMPPSEEGITVEDNIYIVGTLASLKGTYCTNKGYCQFRKVVILDQNDEYYIVEKGTTYGLSIYDHIVLNAELASENDIIY